MKGIILAGGNGTRLRPATRVVSKQLLPVYNKPVIYYPLSCLMMASIREILIISTTRDLPMIQELLGNGEKLGLKIQYAKQDKPNGIAEALIIGKKFINDENVCLILGDNLFYGHDLPKILRKSTLDSKNDATVFAYQVRDPKCYGVLGFDKDGLATSIEEKPQNPKSSWAVTGLYIYPQGAVQVAESLKPSARGELEITDINRYYLEKMALKVVKLGRGFTWLDMGTHITLLSASLFVQTIEERQSVKVACLEEIAYSLGFIDKAKLLSIANSADFKEEADYLRWIADGYP